MASTEIKKEEIEKAVSDIIMNNNEIVAESLNILDSNPEWENIYVRYAENIKMNQKAYNDGGKKFRRPQSLVVYSTIGKLLGNSSTFSYDLRFAGQSVGEIRVRKDDGKVLLCVKDKQSKYAKKKFGFTNSTILKGEDWHSDKAREFRTFYGKQNSTNLLNIKSEEHRIESFLLQDFSKKKSEDKKLCYIQPVRLGGKFFQLTTPFKASTHIPNISLTKDKKGATGGGIDILARVIHNQSVFRFAVIEIKDENNDSECQEKVMHQALIYATFLAKLFRSERGKDWYNILRPLNSKETDVPQELVIDVVTLMPYGNSKEGDLKPIEIPELHVTLCPYTLYYTKDQYGNPKDFFGTLSEAIKKN